MTPLPQRQIVSGLMSIHAPDTLVTLQHRHRLLILAGISAVLRSVRVAGASTYGFGWSPAAAVALRGPTAAVVLIMPGLMAVRGRTNSCSPTPAPLWSTDCWPVAGAQLLYLAVSPPRCPVWRCSSNTTAPVAVVLWMWAFAPGSVGPLTFVGAGIAAVGLVLLLDVLGGAQVDVIGCCSRSARWWAPRPTS